MAVISTNAFAQQCNINLAVLPVTQGEDVPDGSADYLLTRLTSAVAQDGISADPNLGQFFITGKFNHVRQDITPGPPSQIVLHTYLTLYIGDLTSQSVYATTSLELRGVGTSEQRAFINALRSVNTGNKAFRAFIDNGRNKVIDYYNKNYRQILEKASRAAEKHDYAQALWHLVSIPECCVGYEQAMAMERRYFQSFIDQEGIALYNLAMAAWSAQPDQTGASEAFAYLVQIDPESSAYPMAQKLVAEMKASVKSDRDFELREKYHDAIALERARIDAIRQIGVAYGNGQKPTTTNLMWLR